MYMRTLIDTILARCAALGIKNNADINAVDASAVELMLLHVLQGLTDGYDWEMFLTTAEPLFASQAGVLSCALPEDFQRFLLPNDEQTSGLFLWDGTTEWGLTYLQPEEFRRQWQRTAGKPVWFTLTAGPTVVLDPPPDATAAYVGSGTYVRTMTPAILDENVPILFPSALVEMTLAPLALDAAHVASQGLLATADVARTRLINAYARQAQRFQTRTGRALTSTRMT